MTVEKRGRKNTWVLGSQECVWDSRDGLVDILGVRTREEKT